MFGLCVFRLLFGVCSCNSNQTKLCLSQNLLLLFYRFQYTEEVDLEQWGENGERLGTQPTECIIAALLCTPMAYIRLGKVSGAQEKEVIKTNAIAEIGDGGTPLSLVRYSSKGFGDASATEKVMMVGLYRNTKIIPMTTIVDAMNASPEGIKCGKGDSPWVFDGYENGGKISR